ncbi:MAG: alpha/beta hydrolase [Halobacteriaceae archaeon]
MEFPLEHQHVGPTAGTAPAPAVVFVHGRGADEEDLLGLGHRLPDDLHLLSVRAPDSLGPGYTWYEVVEGEGGTQPDPGDFRRSREALDEFVDAAVEAYDVDPDRVGLFGFSQGAILGLASLLDSPERYAWCAALHGYLPASHADVDGFAGVDGAPVFVGAGERDQVIPAERGRAAAERLREGGLDVTFETYRTGHGIGPDELEDVTGWVADVY